MANRDRSQGISFVYLEVAELLAKKDEWTEEGPVPTFNAKTINLNKDKVEAAAPKVENKTPVEQIRENLDRLQTLHHRIHVMLEELNALGGRKKDPKDEN